MSCINDVTTTVATPALSSQNASVSSSSNESATEDFNTVLLKALQNCNGTRPAHVCCCCENSTNEEISSDVDEVEVDAEEATEEVTEADAADKTDVTSAEMFTAGSCFTMFVRISARITTEVSEAVCGKFRDTTLAFADSLQTDKSYNENLLTSYMQKAEEKLSAQTAEIKNYLTDYIDNMLAAIKSSVSGLNTTLLSSSNLLGDSLSSYSNLLSNSSLLNSSSIFGSSDNSSLSSTLLSGLMNTSGSTSLSGYSAIDVANARVTAALNGQSNYTYGIGTSLNTDRYAGRTLGIIRSAEVETTAAGGLRMVDSKGNNATGVAATGIEIGNTGSTSVAKVSTGSTATVINNPCAPTETVSDSTSSVSAVINNADNDDSVKVQLRVAADSSSDKGYSEAFQRKSHIIELFKDMIMKSMSNSVKADDENIIKNIDAKVSISFA